MKLWQPTALALALAAAFPSLAVAQTNAELLEELKALKSRIGQLEDKLKAAEKYEATEFQTGAFLNEGGGKFKWVPFPRAAQNGTVFGIAAGDFTGDGKTDLFLAQNWMNGPQIETSRYDNAVGLLLQNDGQGNMTPLAPLESGIALGGDMKAAAAVDANGDGKRDIVVSRNNAPAAVLLRQ